MESPRWQFSILLVISKKRHDHVSRNDNNNHDNDNNFLSFSVIVIRFYDHGPRPRSNWQLLRNNIILLSFSSIGILVKSRLVYFIIVIFYKYVISIL